MLSNSTQIHSKAAIVLDDCNWPSIPQTSAFLDSGPQSRPSPFGQVLPKSSLSEMRQQLPLNAVLRRFEARHLVEAKKAGTLSSLAAYDANA